MTVSMVGADSPQLRSAYYWSPAQVAHLRRWYGRVPDAELAMQIGRGRWGLMAKAAALGLRKHGELMTSAHVAELFGVSERTVTQRWLRRGWLPGQRGGWKRGRHRVFLFSHQAVEAFIRRFPMRAVPARMPRSWYRELAVAVRQELPTRQRKALVLQQVGHRRCLWCRRLGSEHKVIVNSEDGRVLVLGAALDHTFDAGERRVGERRAMQRRSIHRLVRVDRRSNERRMEAVA